MVKGESSIESKKRWKSTIVNVLEKKYETKKNSKLRHGKEYLLEDFKREHKREIIISYVLFWIILLEFILFDLFLVYTTIKNGPDFFLLLSLALVSFVAISFLKFITLKDIQLNLLEEMQQSMKN